MVGNKCKKTFMYIIKNNLNKFKISNFTSQVLLSPPLQESTAAGYERCFDVLVTPPSPFPSTDISFTTNSNSRFPIRHLIECDRGLRSRICNLNESK